MADSLRFPPYYCFTLTDGADEDVTHCPETIGRVPTSMPRLGDSRASLVPGDRFICVGTLSHVDYFRGSPDGTAYVDVWTPVNEDHEFLLKHRIPLPPAPIGIHRVRLAEPVAVESRDFLGIHYPADAHGGIVAFAVPEDNVIPKSSMHRTLIFDVRDDVLFANARLLVADHSPEFELRAFAIQGFLNPEDVGSGDDLKAGNRARSVCGRGENCKKIRRVFDCRPA